MATEIQRIAEQGVLTLPDAAWERARQRMDVVGPLAALDLVGHQAADDAAHSLGLSRRQVYVLIRRARQGSGLVTDLARGQSSGGKGKGRLSEPVELIIRDLLQKRFLTRQKRSLAALYREVAQACKARNYCFSMLVEAGAKWYQGDQVGTMCERQHPTRPELERRKIMGLLEKKGLIPQNISYPILLPEGDCKVLAMHYDALQEKAYAQNEGDEKTKTLSEAAVILANVESGSCTLKTSALPKGTPVKFSAQTGSQ